MSKVAVTAVVASLLATAAQAAPIFVNQIVIPGSAVDRTATPGANGNRLSIGSDLYYDRATRQYYGLTDRGPGGGTIPYQPRIERFTLDINPNTGAISNFDLNQTILLKDAAGRPLNGLNPTLLNGSSAVLGNSFDSEGIARASNGNFFVSDEYGPSVAEFNPSGKLIRRFTTPANILPRLAGTPNFTDGVTTGRQDNRGFEGLAITPDGKTLFAGLQDPLQEDGLGSNAGRRSRNLRIVRFDVETGLATGQFVYHLDTLATINAVADPAFSATAQGRSIGLSGLTALNDHQFLVIERDNRGVGAETNGDRPGIKSVKLIDVNGATDVSAISLAGTNDVLPAGVRAVSKQNFLDILGALRAAGLVVPEKIEGVAIGPALDLNGDGVFDDLSVILATDNDYSVTQSGSGTQLDVCLPDALPLGGAPTLVAIDSGCPTGTRLLPSFLFSFAIPAADLARLNITFVGRQVPEPAALALFGLGFVGLVAARRRQG